MSCKRKQKENEILEFSNRDTKNVENEMYDYIGNR
jgi:hypothetical protein